jgi:cytochrome P450
VERGVEDRGGSAAPQTSKNPRAATRIHVERGFPLVGVLPELLRNAPGCLTRIAQKRPGEVVGLRIGPITAYLVTHPDHVHHVLQEHWRDFGKGAMWKVMRPLLGDSLAITEGDHWLRLRRLMQPLFSPTHLASLTDLMTDVISREVDRLASRGPGAVIEVDKEMTVITQRILLETMFGASIDRGEIEHLGDQILIAFREMNLRAFLYFLPDRFPLPGDRILRNAIATIDETMRDIVRMRRKSGQQRNDLLSHLMYARDEGVDGGMDDQELRDELVTLLVAGADTTASAMTWLWYMLHRHPDVDRRVRVELNSVLGGRRPTFPDLSRLVYTKMVVQETMRLYPPAWMIPRFTQREVAVGDYVIPADSVVLLSPLVNHLDPLTWPDPERFDPERFDPERFDPERTAKRSRYAYFPFGGGPRQCIGNVFAMMETQLITAMMAQRYRLALVQGHRVVASSSTTLKPRHGMLMTLGSADTSENCSHAS